jgi:hypothetical protein
VASGASRRTELAAGCGTIISCLVPPGSGGGRLGGGRGHREISGSATGLTSRPSAEMCPLTQVPSASASRTAANGGLRKLAGWLTTSFACRSGSGLVTCKGVPSGQNAVMASYAVNPDAVARARQLIDSRQIVLDSNWGEVQPGAAEQNAFLESHSWEEYAQWHLGLTEGASDHTKARYAFVYGDFRRVHRMGIIACQYRAAEWRHKEIELAAHELLQRLDNTQS